MGNIASTLGLSIENDYAGSIVYPYVVRSKLLILRMHTGLQILLHVALGIYT